MSDQAISPPAPLNAVSVAALRVLAAACVLATVGSIVWLVARDGFPGIGGWVLTAVLAAPVLLLAGALLSSARRLQQGVGEVGAFLLLGLVFMVVWVFAWESEMYESRLTIDTRVHGHVFLIGIRPPATWNAGRFLFASLGVVCFVGAVGLVVSVVRQRRSTLRLILGLSATLIIAIAISVPILQQREDARQQHARSSCAEIRRLQGFTRARAEALCENPYNEPFLRRR
ncbi:MAG: hypothetical protein M3290_04830 [Actinomycetota bacterium]|nr:hypothetical protein [Actinomycetota bacterium]